MYAFFSLHGRLLILISLCNTRYKQHSSSSLAVLRWWRKVSLIIGDKSNNKRIRQSFFASLVFMERTRTPQIQRSGCLHLQISTAKFCVFSICSFRYFFSIEHRTCWLLIEWKWKEQKRNQNQEECQALA